MGESLIKLTIRGFKSIEKLEDFKLGKLSVLIGANGAGKSNFVDFFRMLRALADENLQVFVKQQGADGFFFLGPQYTRQISARLEFGQNVYEFDLAPTTNGVQITEERDQYTGGQGIGTLKSFATGKDESQLKKLREEPANFGSGVGVHNYVYNALSSWTVYHFHDTSMFAPMRREQSARDKSYLRSDASNIAAFLLHLKESTQGSYDLIRDTVRLIAPFFDDFFLESEKTNGEEKVRLEWRQRESDFPFQPSQLSDGSIRFICLATALLQPNLPATIVIDEPELGLHPYAVSLLSELVRSASQRTQVILSTQSPTLVDCFDPEDVVIVSRHQGRSVFERLDKENLSEWLEEYTVGELWQKNVVQGGPMHE